MCPIFQVSNVTGTNLDLLKMFLNLLSAGGNYSESEPAEFQVDETYSVPVSSIDCDDQLIVTINRLTMIIDKVSHP